MRRGELRGENEPCSRSLEIFGKGDFASERNLSELRRASITHIVNVGESPNQLHPEDGPFVRLAWCPIEDLVLIPEDAALECLEVLHTATCDGDSNVYIHCVAGWNRSPTILSLYLLACGVERGIASKLVSQASYDAVPFHSKLINEELLKSVVKHGHSSFLPHKRPQAILTP